MCVVRERTWVFGGVPAGPLLPLRLSLDLCACSGVGLGETRRAAWLMARAEGSSLEQAFGLRPRRLFRWEFRRDPPERQLIAPLYSGGQSVEVVWKIPAFVVYLVDALLVVFPSGYENTTAPLSSVHFG